MQLVCDVAPLPHPLAGRWPLYLLIETANAPVLPDSVDAVVDRRLWAYRERQSEAAATLGTGQSLDIALPLPHLDPFVARLPELVAPHRAFTFGHLAEGNVHVQVNGPEPDDDAASDALLAEVGRSRGQRRAQNTVSVAPSRST